MSTQHKLYFLQFLDDWLDFRYAEFFALLRLEGFEPSQVPAFAVHDPNVPEDNDVINPLMSRTVESSKHSLQSLATYLRSNNIIQHFVVFAFSDEAALIRIANRAVLIKSIYELWGHESTFANTVDAVINAKTNIVAPYLLNDPPLSWSIQVAGFGRSLTMPEKQQLRSHFNLLDFPGPVNIKAPEVEMWLLVDYLAHASNVKSYDDNASPTVPCYVGRRLPSIGMKDILKKYSLKTRPYLGPTSLDDSLTFILANLVGCKPGMVSYEPFVGTGSIVVALVHLGVFCIGSDIDPRVLRGEMYAGQETTVIEAKKQRQQQFQEHTRSGWQQHDSKAASTAISSEQSSVSIAPPPRSMPIDVCSNFKTYALPTPELIRMDAHLLGRHFRPMPNFFDVIVTDPPYGIRAGARKSGKRGGQECAYTIPAERRHDHVPSTQTYPVEEVMLDLLDNAARTLVLHGMMVYLIPTTYDFTIQDLPVHPCLAIEEICHQTLSSRHGRRAVVMRKVHMWDVTKDAEYVTYKQRVLSGEDEGFGKLTAKLEAALAPTARQDETVVKQLSNCSQKRRVAKDRRIEAAKIFRAEKAAAATVVDVAAPPPAPQSDSISR